MTDAIAVTLVLLGGAWTLAFNRAAIQLVARGGTGTALPPMTPRLVEQVYSHLPYARNALVWRDKERS